ncbi:MAG TPA: alkaline phosphatase family protein [Thermodesulfovibrionales bacterium]|nr:alkaline phosphatase family protein [Thermodesulfovibrionales bacterium]
MKKPEVMVIGLDGATFDLIDPWVKEGRLPNLARCLDKGTRTRLRSTPLSNSAQAWSSFITGKNAGKHGIYDFFEPKRDDYGIRFINASFRKGNTLWRILSEAGKSVGVINVPITYPAEEINGFIIPGLDAPGVDKDNFSYPSGIVQTLQENAGGYILEAGIWGYIRRGEPHLAVEKLLESIEVRTRAAIFLLKRYQPDFFMVVFTESDKVQHHFWKYMDPERRESEIYADKPYAQAILKVYQRIDQSIGELLKETGENSTTFIMSDHGAGPASNKTMFINKWLSGIGLLAYESNGDIVRKGKRVLRQILSVTDEVVKKRLSRRMKERLLRYFPELRNRVDSLLSLQGIDWSRTYAYSRENHPAIFINLKGRESSGIVSAGREYEDVCKKIIKELGKIKCPETNGKVVGRVFRKEEVYSGEELYRAPDIIFEWKNHSYVHRPSEPGTNNGFLRRLSQEELERSENLIRPSGIHRDHGILISFGKHIKNEKGLPETSIMDLAPTILYRSGIPVPSDMDGRVLFEFFEKDFADKNLIRQTPVNSEIISENKTVTYSGNESKSIEERLRGLGYID